MIEVRKEQERAVLVCYSNKFAEKHNLSEKSLEELQLLAETAGAKVVKTFFQQNSFFDSRYLIGKGKVDEIADFVQNNNIQLVIFENELGFTQFRNLEVAFKTKVLDKTNLILDIFASNARTAQSKLQVELAQLEYLRPRLTRQWTHLSKQFGGIGTKGPGETQIETDRRLIDKKISVLKEKLVKLEAQRKTQAAERKNYYRISLVGYTNAGKSTLLNSLTDSDVYVKNKLFATLDTSTRALSIKDKKTKDVISRFPKKILISDTVGFIKNLPHMLVESFKSTLAEVVESDILLHVIDVSNEDFREQMEAVMTTLKEIKADNKKIINVFNKVDALREHTSAEVSKELMNDLKVMHPNSVFVSAEKGMNLNNLIDAIIKELTANNFDKTVKLKAGDYKGLSDLYNLAEVKDIKYLKNSIKVKINTTEKNYSKLEKMYDFA
ncbi:MAG TPA: GTPase HflX [Ignavibacteria bacterium]|nr:GTPase HflX [Ignavibacteria bacterium]